MFRHEMENKMARPVIGIIGNAFLIADTYPAQGTVTMNCAAISEICDAVPLIFPADPAQVSVDELMDICDGFLLTGARPNVHPAEYGEVATPEHGEFDLERDALALPLTRACIEAGQPILGICRGFQEMAVAMGSSLYPEIRDLPGRGNHRMPPEGTLEEKFAMRHVVTLSPGGPFAHIFGAASVLTNSLHGQGLKVPGPRVLVDGLAPDGTQEAIYIDGAAGFALGVQWHPEWRAAEDPVSRPLFAAFGAAVHAWSNRAVGLRRSA